jgi:uncharacterized protein
MALSAVRIRKLIIRAFFWLAGCYVITGACLYFLQDQLVFHPKKLPSNYRFRFSIPFQEYDLKMNDGRLDALLFKPGKDTIPKGIVLYFEGSDDNIRHYAKYAENFTHNGYEVLMMDYRGYGKSTGPMTEQTMYSDAARMYEIANPKFKDDSIIIYGKSLGTGVAAELATQHTCKFLILETPFYNWYVLAGRYFPIYPIRLMSRFYFPLNEYLPDVKAPVIIFHGTKDLVIPYKEASLLKPLLKPGDEFVTIRNGRHSTLNRFPLFHEKLDSLLR